LKKVFVSAGEASGDMHAAALIRSLKSRRSELEFFGLGGPLMAAEGARLIYDLRQLAVTGFWEVVRRLPRFRGIMKHTLAEVRQERPDLIVLVDYPGMNLRLASALKPSGYDTVYFILPQVWAWKPDRIKTLARNTDLQLAILPFEPKLFEKLDSKCIFIGHPLLDRIDRDYSSDSFREQHRLEGNSRILALLPGSREDEIRRHYPIMLETLRALQGEFPDLTGVTATRDELGEDFYRRFEQDLDSNLVHCQSDRYTLMREAAVSIVASGTATLEAAMCGRPFCVVYRTGWLTYLIAKSLISLEMVGLVNIVAGRKIVPEYLQREMNVANLTSFCREMLAGSKAAVSIIDELRLIRDKLGEPGATERAADLILREFGR
jgi:lipid-A-disaccharide synthase